MNKEKIIHEKGERGKERKKGRKEKRKQKHVVIELKVNFINTELSKKFKILRILHRNTYKRKGIGKLSFLFGLVSF